MISPMTAVGEGTQAIARFVYGLTLGVGAMAAAAGALTNEPSVLIVAPTLVLAISLSRWRGEGLPSPAAGWAGAAIWAALATVTRGDTLVVPLAMIAACVALGVGPERVGDWLARQTRTEPKPEPDPGRPIEPAEPPGWIEENGHRIQGR